MNIGDRVFITDQQHPWLGYSGAVVSGEETYGLGWKGYRVALDGTCGQETYVKPDQVMGPGRVDSITYTIQMESGRYRYVKIDLTDILHIDTGTAVYWKDISHSEVTPEPIGPLAGVCLPTMDINDTENYPKCTWPRWLAWLWKWFHPTKKWKLGPIRYFFIFEGNKQ